MEVMMIHQKGFTLLELVIAIGAVGLIGVVLSQVFFSIVRTNTKVERLAEVKQNGEFALETMIRMIQNAKQITSSCSEEGSTSQSITIVNPDNGSTTFGCTLDGSATRISSSSAEGTEYLSASNVTLGGSDCVGSTIQFTCAGVTGFPQTVTVAFRLAQSGTPVDQFEKASASFQTSVTTRNVSQ